MNSPSILFLDIETAPDVVWTWGVYQANAIAVKEHWYVLSIAWKWWGDKRTRVLALDDFPGNQKKNEVYVLEMAHALMSQADIVVAHNGRDFDVRKLNARFIDHGFKPPSPYKVVDTKSDLARVAKFSSNRLDWLCKQFKIGHKIPHEGFDLWQGCMDGDKAAWKRMKEYNVHDVLLLEKLYSKIAPWIDQPNASLYAGKVICPNPACKSENVIKRGIAYAKTRSYQRYQCVDCGKWTRGVNSVGSTKVTGII